ncbi:MAG: hypothetical protein ACHP93_01365 [Solirubrobacterales bacterium]
MLFVCAARLTPFFCRHSRSALAAPLAGRAVFAAEPVVAVVLLAGEPVVVVALLFAEPVVVVALLAGGAVVVVPLLAVEPVVVAAALALVLVLEPFDELPQAASPSAPNARKSTAIVAEMRLLIV